MSHGAPATQLSPQRPEEDVAMLLRLEDQLRPDALRFAAELQRLNVRVALLTGDERRSAEEVAKAIKIEERPGVGAVQWVLMGFFSRYYLNLWSGFVVWGFFVAYLVLSLFKEIL